MPNLHFAKVQLKTYFPLAFVSFEARGKYVVRLAAPGSPSRRVGTWHATKERMA